MSAGRWHRLRGFTAACSGVLLIMLAGCSPPAEEPGLFGRHRPSHPASSTDQRPEPSPDPGTPSGQRAEPVLPVIGERIWTTGDGSGISFRIAVHGLRRSRDATTLDWSIIPLPGDRLRAGDTVPATVALGASGAPTTFRLIDADAQRVYHPLSDAAGRCLCTRDAPLRAGRTSLRQLSFPSLPEHTRLPLYSVDIPTVALFGNVPAAEDNFVSHTSRTVDLTRPAGHQEIIRWTRSFDGNVAAGGQQMRIGVIAVEAFPDATSVVWSVWTLSSGAGLTGVTAPPITAPADAEELHSVASGLRLRVPRRSSAKAISTTALREQSADGDRCLCTDLRGWTTGMTAARRSVTVVTTLPPLPRRTRTVDVTFPGLPTLPRVTVSTHRRPTVATFSQGTTERWSSPTRQTAPFTPADWPTPLPDDSMLPRFRATVRPLR